MDQIELSEDLAHIKASQLDGTSQGPRLRQKQLSQIHDNLVAETESLRAALQKDLEYTEAEAYLEVYLASSDARKHYESLSLEKELEEEYLVAHGKDNVGRRKAAGVVYVQQAEHSPLYSIIAPLTAAILAGNCVVIELSDKNSSVNALIRKTLSESVKQEIVAITSNRPSDEEFLSGCILVSQESSPDSQTWLKKIKSHSGRVIAIVDRTADLEQSAKAIVNASFGFGGRSPYSPHLVLVNEFVEEDFVRAAVLHASRFSSRRSYSRNTGSNAHIDRVLKQGVKSKKAEIALSGSAASIVKVKSRTSEFLQLEISDAILLIHTVTSLDDAIDVANKNNSLLASYLFATPKNAKYLSQFVDSHLSCVNYIPTQALAFITTVGPAAPVDYPFALESRYTQSMFEKPSGVVSQQSTESKFLQSVLLEQQPDKTNQTLHAIMIVPLKPIAQKKGGSIGFFEQGLIVGGVIYLSVIVSTIYAVSRYAIIPAVQHYRG